MQNWESPPVVIDSLPVWEPDHSEIGASREYYLEDSAGGLEEQIAQTVLDTYDDVHPLMWNSSTAEEIEPPPRVAGEEPIRDPGDAAPFEELQNHLRQAVDAIRPVEEDRLPETSSLKFDIVLPESDEEATATGSKQRSENPSGETSYNNLFSKIRRRKQA